MYGQGYARSLCKACSALGDYDQTAVVFGRRQLCATHRDLYAVVEPWVNARWDAPVPEGTIIAEERTGRTIACPCGEEHEQVDYDYPFAVTVACGGRTFSRLEFIDKWVAYLFSVMGTMPFTVGEHLEDMGHEIAFYERARAAV